ncbi:MAG: type III-A CRISPR-associated RAMP protein Csm4 [Anaerolineae bacterium]|nr:type III-A CRISPR-associated RAMP protein Csm4 [Anaerolineae bacterium]MCI0609633.1 type III-A CRISPR-associated RAMP protein Csm4 [Anaerolineae bacterium]
MAKRVCYHLAPRGPFHFGERGVGMEEVSVLLHADTLFSALCLTLAELGEDLESLLAAFPRLRFGNANTPQALSGAAPFLLSSAFPYWATKKEGRVTGIIHIFPKPYMRLRLQASIDDPKKAKLFKKVQFVSKPIFESILKATPLSFTEEHLIQGNKIWLTSDEKAKIPAERIWVESTQPHVTVDRDSNASQVYAVGEIRFENQAGLFFLVDYNKTEWQPVIEKALRALGESGLGGERSSGRGQFDLFIAEDFSLNLPSDANAFTTLALYWPLQQEIQNGILNAAGYSLIQRRGWVGAPGNLNLRRRGVRMLTEGSVFTKLPTGALADVKPLDPENVPTVPHDIWRYGMAFPVPCRIMQEDRDE